MKFNIGHKVGSGFAAALIILIILGTLSYSSISRLLDTLEQVDRLNEARLDLYRLSTVVNEAETASRGFILTGESAQLGPYEGAAERSQAMVDELAGSLSDPGQRERAEALRPLLRAKFDFLESTIRARRQAGLEAAREVVIRDEGGTAMSAVRAVLDELAARLRANAVELEQTASAQALRTKSLLPLGILTTVIVIGLAAVRLGRHISAPLGQVTDAAEHISQGDLSVSLPTSVRSDEIGVLLRAFAAMKRWLDGMAGAADSIAAGDLTSNIPAASPDDRLAQAFRKMRDTLRRTTEELQEASDTLASSASDILAATTQMAAGAGETAAAIAQTTTTVEEVKQTAQLSSDKSRKVSESAQHAVKVAKDGQQAVEDALASMERIRDQVASVAETVVRLSEQSQSIGEIVATVSDIADQSNLLAVNAAIEAARAGEHGKGFSVVAQEVRSLAEQSKEATTQVRAILNDTQQAISGVVLAAEQSGKTVDAGIRQSRDAGTSIQRLADVIEDNAEAALQIAASSHQQAVGVDQISSVMKNIREASAQNASGAKQTEATARNLNALGTKLQELLGSYRT